jgi:hypothetical protein
MQMPPVPPRPYDRRSSGTPPDLRNDHDIGPLRLTGTLPLSDPAAVVRDRGIVDAGQVGDCVEVRLLRS